MKGAFLLWAGELGYLEAGRHESTMPALWKAGCLNGSMEALMENAPMTCKSFALSERITALQAL